MTERYVRMKPLKELVRKKLIHIEHMSDDGEYLRYKILPNGPTVGHWNREGELLLVVNCSTVHENELKMAPQLYTDTTAGAKDE